MNNEQELFWMQEIDEDYVADNNNFDGELGKSAWSRILSKVNLDEIRSFLDCGSNIGRNIRFLSEVLPNSSANLIELAEKPFLYCKKTYSIQDSYLGPIKSARFETNFDLVFTSGVLIHVNPDDLLETMAKMYDFSKKYILIAEHFSRTPISINYRGEDDKLFKRDFGKLFIENFDVKLVDYGFLWGHEFDAAGFDDITYWLFQK
jgi:pseudaminic acid biosynthesis-associated methylase